MVLLEASELLLRDAGRSASMACKSSSLPAATASTRHRSHRCLGLLFTAGNVGMEEETANRHPSSRPLC